MANDVVTCPHCAKEIPLSEALAHRIREQAKRELEQESARQKAEIAKERKALADREAQWAEDKRRAEEENARKFQAERERIEKEAVRRSEEKRAVELRDLQQIVEEQKKKLEISQQAELDIRRQKRELEEQKKELALTVQRQLDQERKRVEEQTLARAQQEYHQRQLEADKREADLRKTIDDLKRKIEQGSQQTQGEVVELELESQLRALFPTDVIEPVSKGIRGADVVHRVLRNGKLCGTIIWESKQTKLWSDGWVDKLKVDQREAKADVAVLLTAALPKGVANFAQVSRDVWVTNHACAGALASTLRWAVIQHSLARSLAEGTDAKMKALYAYLSGPEFRQRVEAIVDASELMREQLEREKRLYQKNWSEREKLISRVGESLTGMHGDLQGLGAALQHIDSIDGELEGPAGTAAPQLTRRAEAGTPAGQPVRASSGPVVEDDELF